MEIAKETVRSIFAELAGETPEKFFTYVANNVSWTVLGTHPLAGHYTSKRAFEDATFERLGKLFNDPLKLYTRDVLIDRDKAIVELYTQVTSRNGVQFNNEYCWICQFQGERIVEVRAYLDSALVATVIDRG